MVIECGPMASITAGSRANALFWGRDYLAVALMTRAIVEQYRVCVPGLKITTLQTIAMPIIASAGATAFMILMASRIGFPLPFALVIGIPVWLVVLVVSFVLFFGRVLTQDAELRKELVNYTVVLLCQVLLTFVYPAYLYGFVQVGTIGQNFYLGLLTLIKLVAKNWMSYFLDKKYDLVPQIMIFNVDVLNALYVSSSMQNSKSITSMLLMIALDATLAWVSITDIRDLMGDIVLLRRKIPKTHPLHSASFVEIALQIIKEDDQARARLSRHGYIFGISTLKLPDVDILSEESTGAAGGPKTKRIVPIATLKPQLSVAAIETFKIPDQAESPKNQQNLLNT